MYDMYCFPRPSVCDHLSSFFCHKIGSILEIVIRLGYFEGFLFITAYLSLPTYVRVYVRSSVCLQFCRKNACTSVFVNHLGYCEEFRWIFIHYGIDVATAIRQGVKKVRKKDYKRLLNPCTSVCLSAFSSQKSCVLNNL